MQDLGRVSADRAQVGQQRRAIVESHGGRYHAEPGPGAVGGKPLADLAARDEQSDLDLRRERSEQIPEGQLRPPDRLGVGVGQQSHGP